jgi:hypothetical protein
MENVHQLGNYKVIKDQQTKDAANDGIYFPVEARPLSEVLDPALGIKVPHGQQAVIRTDSNEILHVPKTRFQLLPNSEVFPMIEEAISKSHVDMSGMKIRDNMAFSGGMTVRTYTFPNHIVEPKVGDITQLEMKVINSYNGGSQFKAHIGGMRLACLNGMVMPHGQLNLIGARHTKGLAAKLPNVVAKMIKALEIFNTTTESWSLMTEKEITDAQALSIIEKLPQSNERLTDRLRCLWLDHKDEMGPTMWALYNALTYWSTHEDIRASSRSNAASVVLERESKVQRVLESAVWNQTLNLAA